MRPEESARSVRRIARVVDANPSREATANNLRDLVAAVNGDKAAAHRLAMNVPSAVPEMAELNRAFTAAGVEAPEMRYCGRGRWVGLASSVRMELRCSPDAQIQKVLVAGRPVTSWREAVESVRFHAAMADNGTPEDPEDLEAAAAALGSNAFHCVQCNGRVDLAEDFACKGCGTEYVSCPGCDLPYPMDKNEDDHCPLCGYSSWSELPEDVADEYLKFLVDGVKKAAETRQPQDLDFQGFTVRIEIVDEDGSQVINFSGGDDFDTQPLEEWMGEPSIVLSGGLDSARWSGPTMEAPRPYKEPAGGGGVPGGPPKA